MKRTEATHAGRCACAPWRRWLPRPARLGVSTGGAGMGEVAPEWLVPFDPPSSTPPCLDATTISAWCITISLETSRAAPAPSFDQRPAPTLTTSWSSLLTPSPPASPGPPPVKNATSLSLSQLRCLDSTPENSVSRRRSAQVGPARTAGPGRRKRTRLLMHGYRSSLCKATCGQPDLQASTSRAARCARPYGCCLPTSAIDAGGWLVCIVSIRLQTCCAGLQHSHIDRDRERR